MTYSNLRNQLKQYGQVGAKSSVETASAHRLIQMLFEGALEKIAFAKGHMQRGEIAQKGENISKAISIVQGLQSSLDMSVGGEIAENLNNLYEYMQVQLLDANVNNKIEKLDEVHGLLRTIKEGWDGIPDDLKNKPASSAEDDLPPDPTAPGINESA